MLAGKICERCGEGFVGFGRKYCRLCANKARLARRHEDAIRARRERPLRPKCNRHGITVAKYQALLDKNHNSCEVCGEPFVKKDEPCIDHDHVTNKVRGLLCRLCNTGLGCFRDDVDLFPKACEYLEQ